MKGTSVMKDLETKLSPFQVQITVEILKVLFFMEERYIPLAKSDLSITFQFRFYGKENLLNMLNTLDSTGDFKKF